MSLGPERVWITINVCQLDNKTARLRDTTKLWYGMVWSALLYSDPVFFGMELCAVVRYHMPGVALYGMVSYDSEWGATQLFTRPRSIGCEHNGHRNRTMTMELCVMKNH